MITAWERRRTIRAHAAIWAIEAVETYGENADAVLQSAAARYGRAERYAFRCTRKAIARIDKPTTLLTVVRDWAVDAIIKGPSLGEGYAR
jgi:hypothetical protein